MPEMREFTKCDWSSFAGATAGPCKEHHQPYIAEIICVNGCNAVPGVIIVDWFGNNGMDRCNPTINVLRLDEEASGETWRKEFKVQEWSKALRVAANMNNVLDVSALNWMGFRGPE